MNNYVSWARQNSDDFVFLFNQNFANSAKRTVAGYDLGADYCWTHSQINIKYKLYITIKSTTNTTPIVVNEIDLGALKIRGWRELMFEYLQQFMLTVFCRPNICR